MAENKMFCFQCQETAKGTGCTIKGVCGKEATTSKWQDLLLSVVRGIGTIQHSIGEETTPEVTHFLTDALFTTITNANFNDQDILQKVDKGIVLKKQLLEKAASMNIHLPAYQEVIWGGEKTDYEAEGARESVLRHENQDVRSLKELTMLGLKGMAAYYEHAAHLGEENSEIISFMCRALATISNPDADMDTLLGVVLETGKYGVDVMALLDKANTQAYGNPELTRVNIGTGSNPGILISGHDLKDIEDLLIQTEGTGIESIPMARCFLPTTIRSSRSTSIWWATTEMRGGNRRRNSRASTVLLSSPPTASFRHRHRQATGTVSSPPTLLVSLAGSISRRAPTATRTSPR